MKLWGDSVMTAVPHLHFPGTARLILIPTLCQVYFCPPLVLRCTHSIKVTLLLRLTNSPGYESMYQSNNSSGLFYKTLQLLQGDFAAYFSSYCRCQIIIASLQLPSYLGNNSQGLHIYHSGKSCRSTTAIPVVSELTKSPVSPSRVINLSCHLTDKSLVHVMTQILP